MKDKSSTSIQTRSPKLLGKKRELMLKDIGRMILKCRPRLEIEETLMTKYKYSWGTTADIICEAQRYVAKKFTDEEILIAKQQIKEMCESVMSDEDEISLSKLRAGELLGKLMKAFNPDIAIQNNTTNNINLSELTLSQLKELLTD